MAISCPSCQAEIAVADVNVGQGIALCRACNQVCRLADLAAAAPPPRQTKPAGTRIELAEIGERLVVSLPRGMNKGIGLVLLAVGGLWTLGTCGHLLSTLLGLVFADGSVHPKDPGTGIDWSAVVGGVFFAAIGLAILASGIYVLTVRIALSIDRDSVTLVRAAFGREWASVRPTANATTVRRVERYKQNDQPIYGVGIDFSGGGTLKIGSALSNQELDWLCSELAHALRRCGAQVT